MNVFISWSGERSKHIASGLRRLVTDTVQSVLPFMSAHDIEAGSRWLDQLNIQLDKCSFGIVCLTPENLNSQWILYECGALGKALGASRVCPLLFAISPTDLEFPLAQFQSLTVDKSEVKRLLLALSSSVSPSSVAQRKLVEAAFSKAWPRFRRVLTTVPKVEDVPQTTREILAELASSVNPNVDGDTKDLDERILEIVRRQTGMSEHAIRMWEENKP